MWALMLHKGMKLKLKYFPPPTVLPDLKSLIFPIEL